MWYYRNKVFETIYDVRRFISSLDVNMSDEFLRLPANMDYRTVFDIYLSSKITSDTGVSCHMVRNHHNKRCKLVYHPSTMSRPVGRTGHGKLLVRFRGITVPLMNNHRVRIGKKTIRELSDRSVLLGQEFNDSRREITSLSRLFFLHKTEETLYVQPFNGMQDSGIYCDTTSVAIMAETIFTRASSYPLGSILKITHDADWVIGICDNTTAGEPRLMWEKPSEYYPRIVFARDNNIKVRPIITAMAKLGFAFESDEAETLYRVAMG